MLRERWVRGRCFRLAVRRVGGCFRLGVRRGGEMQESLLGCGSEIPEPAP